MAAAWPTVALAVEPALPPTAAGALLGVIASAQTRERAIHCLTQAIYYEAGSEPLAGKEAVAQVVLNRVRHPSFPKSVCGVVYDGSARSTGCQFTFTCDGSLLRRPMASKWDQAEAVATDALSGRMGDVVGPSTHYHASWMVPYWRASMAETARIGGHVFYRMPGAGGAASALSGAYSGVEPEPVAPRIADAALEVFRGVATRRRHGAGPSRPGQPTAFSVWGLQIATVTPSGGALAVRDDR